MLELQNKNMKELREMGRKLGLPMIQHEKMEQLRARIVIMMEPGVVDSLTVPDLNPVKLKVKKSEPETMLTPQQVMDALLPFKGKIKLAFYDDEGEVTTGDTATSWCIKNGPAEDSGSLSVPLKWIKFKAQEIANARFPAVINGEFDAVRGIPVLA